MSEKILITGITGFVGSHLADYALSKGHTIYGLKRWNLSRMRNVRHILDKINWIDCDLTDSVSVTKAIKQSNPDKIFHLAAESFVSPSWDHPTHYMDVNYKGTVNLFEGIRTLEINPRVLIPGSGEEYGEVQLKDLPINNSTILNPVNPYAVTKIAQDLISFVYFKSFGTKVIRTRTFNHEGPRRENVFGISSYAYQIARIERGLQEPIVKVGVLTDKRNFTHVQDIVKAYWLASNKCKLGELYLIGNEKKNSIFTFKQVLNMLIKLSTENNIQYKEYKPFVRPTKVPFLIADIKKFKKETGWKPNLTIEDILKDTLNHWRNKLDKQEI